MLAIGNYIGKFSGQTAGAIASAYQASVEEDGGVVESLECLTNRIAALRNLGLWDKASAVWLPHGYKESKLYAVKGGSGVDLGFTRAGTRYRKASSLVEQVPYNLLSRSEEFDNGVWTKLNTTISTNATIAPDGSLTANKINDNTTNQRHTIHQTVSVRQGPFTYSVYAKSAGESRYLIMLGFGLGGADEIPVFDLDSGTVDSPSTTTIFQSATIENQGDGWYLCTVHLNCANELSTQEEIGVTNQATNNSLAGQTYVGNGSGIYIWGAQIVAGTESRDYFKTTDRFNVPSLDYTGSTCPALSLEPARTNLLLRSEEFDNASWAKFEATVTANTIAGPDGLSTADSLLESANNAAHFIQEIVSKSASAIQYTVSVYAKPNGRDWIRFSAFNGSSAVRQWFNVSSGIVGSSDTVNVGWSKQNATISPAGDGFYRCTFTFTTDATGSVIIAICTATGDLSTSFAGNTSFGLYIFGAQLEQASYATSYIPTNGSTASRIADSVPALLPKGTNACLQSQTMNNASWTKVNATVTADATTAPDGNTTADKIHEDAINSSHSINATFSVNIGQEYTVSCHFKAAERGFALLAFNVGFTLTAIQINLTTGVVTSGTGSPLNMRSENKGNGWWRVSFSSIATSTTSSATFNLYVSTDGVWANRSYVGNATNGIYAWGAQVEQGDEATEYVATTTAPVHNGTVIGQTEGTLYFEGSSFADQTSKHILMISDGTNNNRVQIYITVTDTINGFVGAGGVQQALISGPTLIAGSVYKVAITYQTNKAALFVNGTKIGEDLTVTVPLCQQINMAQGAQFMGNGKAWSVLPTALTDVEAIAVTTP